jgi:hypothetical protein
VRSESGMEAAENEKLGNQVKTRTSSVRVTEKIRHLLRDSIVPGGNAGAAMKEALH